MSRLHLTTIKIVVHHRNLGPRRQLTISLLGKSLRVSRRSPRYLRSIGGIWGRREHTTDFRGITRRRNRHEHTFNLKFYREMWSARTSIRINKPLRQLTRIVMAAIWYRTISTLLIKLRPTIITFSVTRRSLVKRLNSVVSRARNINWSMRPGNKIRPELWSKSFVGWNENFRRTPLRAPVGSTFTNIFIIITIITTRRRLFDSFFVRGAFARMQRDSLVIALVLER